MELLVLAVAFAASPARAQMCKISYGSANDAKPNKLYLYFPTADDSTYPEFGVGGLVTSPAHAFNIADLTTYTGNVADLRDAVFQVVSEDYCEFDVQVIQTTTAPPTTATRRNTVAIGSDSAGSAGTETWGQAQAVDTGDPTAVDFARVWAGSYNFAGSALSGANAILTRWAYCVGGTAAHEAGHNYGLAHSDGLVVGAGEDALVHHIMAAGSNYSYSDRAGYRRHFSDHEYSLLASNVGLAIQTMWNWDLVNPNAETATKLRMEFLSTQPSLILWSYDGSLSPWVNPMVTGPSGTATFKGTTYNRYQIEWSTGQTWDHGSSGQGPGGANFPVGATFSSVNFSDPDPIIITNVTLFDASGTALALHPRVPGYDAGTLDKADGTLTLRFFNFDTMPLVVENVVVRNLPRILSLDEMVPEGKWWTFAGDIFGPGLMSGR